MTKKLTSSSWEIVKKDMIKVGIGLLIAIGGAVATWLETDLLNAIDFSVFGAYELYAITLVTALNSALVNFIRKLISTTEY